MSRGPGTASPDVTPLASLHALHRAGSAAAATGFAELHGERATDLAHGIDDIIRIDIKILTDKNNKDEVKAKKKLLCRINKYT